jgi:uncharacterized peroxidase-related enzyme
VKAVAADFREGDLTPRQRALCEFAYKATVDLPAMDEGDVQSLREVGLSDAGVLDTVLVTAFFNYINRVVDAIGLELEPYEDPLELVAHVSAATTREETAS